MFSSKAKDPIAAPQSINSAATPVKRIMREHVPSIISGDLIVSGTLTSSGDMQIDGRVEGDIRSAGLVIGDKAEIHGEIYAEDLTVRGKVIGSIRARKVLLCATSHVEGDILHEAFAVESGAFFEGNCRHSDNPLATPEKTSSRKLAAPQAVALAQPVAPVSVNPVPVNQGSVNPGPIAANPVNPVPAAPVPAPPPAVTPPPAASSRSMATVATLAPLGSAI